MRLATYLSAAWIWAWPCVLAQQNDIPTFGTTVVAPGGLVGILYYIPPNSTYLPDFSQLNPIGVFYTPFLNVTPRHFLTGFPGITNRFEWFAIDYTGRFWISKPAVYQFALTSDDGSKLYIDDELVVNNDGIHDPQRKVASLGLTGGIHRIRVSYFQGPRPTVALMLQVAGPGEPLRTFSTDEFKPPPDPENWTFSDQQGRLTAMKKRELRISPAAGSPGDEVELELSFQAPEGAEIMALQWQTAVPVQVLEWAGAGPEIGQSARDANKFVRCSMTRSYVYTCLLAGGERPLMSGPLAIFHFKIRSGVQRRTTAVQIEQVKAVTLNGQEYNLSSAEAEVNIR